MNGTLAITLAARYGTDREKMKDFRDDSNWESFALLSLEGGSGDYLYERTLSITPLPGSPPNASPSEERIPHKRQAWISYPSGIDI